MVIKREQGGQVGDRDDVPCDLSVVRRRQQYLVERRFATWLDAKETAEYGDLVGIESRLLRARRQPL